MVNNWNEYTIDELQAPVKGAIAMGPFGSRIKAENFVTEGVPIIKGAQLHGAYVLDEGFDYLTAEKAEELKSSQAVRGDLVITHRGTIGQVSLIPENSKYEKYIVSQSQLKVSLDHTKVNPYFINYFFRSHIGQHRLLANASQVGVPAIAKASTSVKAISVPCPSLDEQQQIIKHLKTIDDKIELNRQMNETLEAMAQALFKSWFVDFDPVIDNALLAGKAIPEPLKERAEMRQAQLNSGKANSNSQINDLFPSEFEFTEELGWIPRGWDIKCFGDVSLCFDKNRVPLSKKQREEKKPGYIPYHGATSVMDYINEWIFDDIYLLIGEDGSVIKEDGSPFVQYIWGKSWVNNHAHVLQGKDDVSTEHLMLFMQAQNLTPYITGAVQLKINQKNMNSIPFLYAGEALNKLFSKTITPYYSKLRNSKEENEILAKLRDTLLPKLISGELRIADAEKLVADI